jgi:hypothetical protein
MGLAEQQRLLARLATETALRERFLADPESVGAQSGLAPGDIQALTHAPPGPLTFFARSLLSKRLGEVRKLLPLTCRTLGSLAAPLFRHYAAAMSIPIGLHRHRQDALSFAAFLLPRIFIGPDFPPWLPDLLRYEAGWLKAADPACRRQAERFRYAILPLLQSLNRDEPPVAIRRPTLALWWRFSPHGSLRHRVLSFLCLPALSG